MHRNMSVLRSETVRGPRAAPSEPWTTPAISVGNRSNTEQKLYLRRAAARALDEVEPAFGDAGAVTIATDAADDEGVPGAQELVLPGHFLDELVDGRVLKL